MTFDDGVVKIYKITNIAAAGQKPKEVLGEYQEHSFGYGTVGVQRYYTALQAHQLIEDVISIPDWYYIDPEKEIAVKEDESQYRIRQVQRTYDDEGLQITRLSLERIGERYASMS